MLCDCRSEVLGMERGEVFSQENLDTNCSLLYHHLMTTPRPASPTVQFGAKHFVIVHIRHTHVIGIYLGTAELDNKTTT